MLMIRFQRFGRKNDPSFRIVLTDKRNAPKSGKFLEILGFYNPKTKAKKIQGERIKYWINNGAKLSTTANNLLIKEKVISGKTINMVPKFADKSADSNADISADSQRPVGVEVSNKLENIDN